MTRYFEKLNLSPRIVEVFGRFPPSTVAVTAKKSWQHSAGKYCTLTYTATALKAVQDAFSVGIADTALGAYSYLFSTTHNDCRLSTFSETGWYVEVNSHASAGAGVLIYEDTTAKVLTITFETGVSTMATLMTAVNASCTKVRAFAGGGAGTGALTLAADVLVRTAMDVATYTAWLTTDTATVMRVAATITGTAATLTHVMAVINESTLATKKITASLGAGAAGADDVTTALSNTVLDTTVAVDAVAIDSAKTFGEGFTVARTGASGTGEYTVTLDRGWNDAQLIESHAAIQLPNAEATLPQAQARIGLYTKASKTFVITTYNPHTPAVIDLIYAANRWIHFHLKFLVNR
jgi:hypothetical protein